MLGVALSGAAGSAEEVVGLPEMFVAQATMRDGPVGPGRLPEESTARSGFSCSSPEPEKGRITDVYETLSPLAAGSVVSIICSLALSRRGRRAHASRRGDPLGDRLPGPLVPGRYSGTHALPPSRRARSSLRVNGAGLEDRTARTPPKRASAIEPASHRCGPQGLESCLSSLLLGWMIELRRSPRIRCAPPSRRTRLRAVAPLPPPLPLA